MVKGPKQTFSPKKSEVKVKSLSRLQLLVTPMDYSLPGPPSIGFSRQEYWSGLTLPSPRFYVTMYIFWSVTKINHYLLKPLNSVICSQTYLHLYSSSYR